MLFGHYSFHCELQDPAVLPPFKGSTFRGAFGHALKNVSCALKHEQCHRCLVRDRCVYAVVFETPQSRTDGKASSPPHPFVIEPPDLQDSLLGRKKLFRFRLLIFGRANESLPYFVYAFEQMGKTGIGKKIHGKRASYRLVEVSSQGKTLYYADTGQLHIESPLHLKLEEANLEDGYANELVLTLETPLRVKRKNKLSGDLPFDVLVRTALRRISDLNNHWGDGEPDLDYRGLVDLATTVAIVESELEWVSFRRYSSRQETSVSLAGMVGSIHYHGDMRQFLPLLRYCEKVHLGKATTFGFGKIRLEILNRCGPER